MFTLKTTASFDSAHFLAGYEGKCSNIHGHHWVIEVRVSGRQLETEGVTRGMIIDFGDLKHEVRKLADSFDHALLYENGTLRSTTLEALREEGFCLIALPFRPTAENFARHFYLMLTGRGLPVRSVTVYETPENGAVYEED